MSIIFEALKKIEEKQEKRQSSSSKRISKYIFVVIIGMILFSFFSISINFSRSKTKNKPVAIHSSSKLPTLTTVQQKQDVLLPPQEEIEVKEAQIEYILQGIIYDEENPIALINGKRVSIGDNIQGAYLVSISDGGVELETKEGKVYIPW